jgi:hypothetical protein
VQHRSAETHQQKNETISIYIVSIIGYRRPEAQIGRGWEAVCSIIAKDIVTIIGFYIPEEQVARGAQLITCFLPLTPLQQAYFRTLELFS